MLPELCFKRYNDMTVNAPLCRKVRGKTGAADRAFTLVEVMVSVTLLALMFICVYTGYISGFGMIETTREDLRATQILTQKLEAIRLCTWQQLSNCPATFTEYYNPNGVTNATQGIVYVGTISAIGSATNIPNTVSYQGQVHLITMSVTWTNTFNKGSVAHTRQMQTLSAYNGLENYIW